MNDIQNPAEASVISTDLLAAWHRSEHKIDGWNHEKAANAVERYQKFLLLIAKQPGLSYAPTRDIDEIWHLHMLSPRAYQHDCDRLFGDVLDHDGGFGKEEDELPILKAVFERTAAMWEEAYGEPYVVGADAQATKCWHDCQGRCWHACKSNIDPIFDKNELAAR